MICEWIAVCLIWSRGQHYSPSLPSISLGDTRHGTTLWCHVQKHYFILVPTLVPVFFCACAVLRTEVLTAANLVPRVVVPLTSGRETNVSSFVSSSVRRKTLGTRLYRGRHYDNLCLVHHVSPYTK